MIIKWRYSITVGMRVFTVIAVIASCTFNVVWMIPIIGAAWAVIEVLLYPEKYR